MLYSDLRAALQPRSGTTTITVSTLTANVATLLNAVTSGAPIVITSAEFGPGDGIDGTVVITGTSSLFNAANLAVRLRGTVDADGNAQVMIIYGLIGATAAPSSWRFSTSFPTLPAVVNWAGTWQDPTAVALDQLALSNASYILASSETTDPATGVSVRAGANFVAQLRPAGPIATILGIFTGTSRSLLLHGTILTSTATDIAVPLQPGQWPWQLAHPPPGICLQASLGVDHPVGKMQISGLGLWIYSPLTQNWLNQNPTYEPVLAYTGTLSVPSAKISGAVVAPAPLGGDSLVLLTTFTGVSVTNLASMADALGTNSLQSQLPSQISGDSAGLGDLQLIALALELSADPTAPGLTWAAATIGMPQLNWQVWPGVFAVDSIAARFEVTTPFTTPAFDVTVYGRVEVHGIPVDVSASSKEGFTVYAQLETAQTIPLSDLVRAYAPSITPPGNLTVDAFQVAIAPARYYALALSMAQQPNPWVIPLGTGSGVAISDVTMSVTIPAAGASSGSFGGTIGFDTIGSLSIRYDVPGPVTLRGTLAEVKLSSLIRDLSNQPVSLPNGFDLTFVQSTVLIQGQAGGTYLFQLGTQVQGVGSLAFQAQRIAGQWGFAVGFDLAAVASSLPGLSALRSFEGLFNLTQLVVVASSFDGPGFTFPDLAAFNNPTIQAKTITLPAGASGIAAGLNVYAQWTLDTSNQQQLLKKLLGLHPTLGVTLQVGADPATNSKLFVTWKTMINGLPLTCEFGGLIQGGDVGLFLVGSMQASIQNTVQTFDVTLLFVENGAFIAGTMQGATTIDFGSFRLGNLALEIGTDWEGIPSLGIAATIDTSRFEASVAVFFDSANPAKSLVAGSVSSLTLADVLAVFLPEIGPTPLDGILSQIALKGTGTFSVPGSVGAALDTLDMASVSAAFAQAHVTIPANTSQVLIVNPDRHVAPGTRWYLTDLTADSGSGLRHYELATQPDGTIAVSLSPQFYCAPQATSIGTFVYPQGFFITTAIDLFGWHASVTVIISGSSGIAIDAALDPIIIASAQLLSLTGYQGAGGPALSLATFTQPNEPQPTFRPPHFFASGDLRFLGLNLANFYIDITSQGFVFDIVGNVLPLVTFDLHGHFRSDTDFAAGGSLTAGFSNVSVDLGLSSGPVSLNTNAIATVDVSYDGNAIVATCRFTFDFQGQSVQVANFELDVTTGPLADIRQIILDRIRQRLLHADISLHIDNTVQQHLDQQGSSPINNPGTHTDTAVQQHIDNTTGSHIDNSGHDWQNHPTHQDIVPSHQDQASVPHLDQSTPHQDQAGSSHIDSPTTHQDQSYHVDQGVETQR
ncbi:MAG: hypothetical protein ACRDRS_12525 [Pseudonocardiaceae bacterium]